VFDAVVGRSTGTVWVGRGAWTYEMIGRCIPAGVVGWLWERKQKRSEGQLLGPGGIKGIAAGKGTRHGWASDVSGGESGGEGSIEWENVGKGHDDL